MRSTPHRRLMLALAAALIFYSNMWAGACLSGYFETCFRLRYNRDGYHYKGRMYKDFLGVIFGSLGNGYTLGQAVSRDAWFYENYIFSTFFPDDIFDFERGECKNRRWPMPPYPNLRLHGRPNTTQL